MDFSSEIKLQRSGHKVVVGVDEVGRGPLAGPVTAAAVTGPAIFNFKLSVFKHAEELRDSKKLTPQKREEFYRLFQKEPRVEWAVASVYPRVIDSININEATKLASKRAVLKLEGKIGESADMLLLDGTNRLALAREQLPIIRGDEKIASCAIASIIAKVTRDRMMLRYHKKYPQYRFDLHKGYGTRLHFEMIRKYSPSPIHRVSFNLMKEHSNRRRENI